MEEKVSIIIPNFNGEQILSKNLPNVIREFPKTQTIVVDDASTDGSVKLIESKFKSVKLIKLKKNKGFAQAVNAGVNEARGKYVILLNSDVSPKKIPLKNLLSNFKDPNLFAIGFLDISHENGTQVKRGRGGAGFKKGFLTHFALKPEKGDTLWVSGGSGIFDREKFIYLSGFDKIYAPFYWEDIDLSYRAAKLGYKCLFEPGAVVDHFHDEGAIKKSKRESDIKKVSYKNQFLFVWKNIEDPLFLLQHIAWLPFHLIKAAVNFDLKFFYGFLWAITQIPQFLFSENNEPSKLSDREVLKKYEQQ